MLQRIYGVCYENEEDLNAHLVELEEAKLRDHRRIGKEQEIYMNHELIGAGMPLWLPNGAIIRKNLENYIYDKELFASPPVCKRSVKQAKCLERNNENRKDIKQAHRAFTEL